MAGRRIRYGLVACVALAAAAIADDTHAPPDIGTVTVHGARDPDKLNHLITEFVGAITHNATTGSLARWYVPVCPLVAGLSREKAEYFLQRISDAARDAGAPLAAENCAPNLLVVITSEPHELLERWSAKSPTLFSKARGPFAVKRFMNSTLPVRAWYNAGDDCAGRMATFEIQTDILNVACKSSGLASRLSKSTIRVVGSAIVIVDKEQIKGFKVGQIADYVAMVGLAELVEPDAELPAPSVLNMFVGAADAKVSGMSDWDKWFLAALYHSNPRNTAQASEIRVEMFRDAVAAEPPQ